jgi:hypothetical protein
MPTADVPEWGAISLGARVKPLVRIVGRKVSIFGIVSTVENTPSVFAPMPLSINRSSAHPLTR